MISHVLKWQDWVVNILCDPNQCSVWPPACNPIPTFDTSPILNVDSHGQSYNLTRDIPMLFLRTSSFLSYTLFCVAVLKINLKSLLYLLYEEGRVPSAKNKAHRKDLHALSLPRQIKTAPKSCHSVWIALWNVSWKITTLRLELWRKTYSCMERKHITRHMK